jgi:SAM-dependent methyltransferase
MTAEKDNKLTEKKSWETYWKEKPDVIEIRKKKHQLFLNEILTVFDKNLPVNENYHALEIGGAPGKYLMYLVKNFKYHAHSLDYSKIGNEQTKKYFAASAIPVEVYERDLFLDNKDLPKFDIVFSLGLIEHFENPELVVSKHVELLKPGGILLLGVPNLTGIYHLFLKVLAPSHDKNHNLSTMDILNWKIFETKLHLIPIFKGYVGGFEPVIMKKMENKNPPSYFLYFVVLVLMVIFSFQFKFLRKFNSKFWSGYLIGIYKKNINA